MCWRSWLLLLVLSMLFAPLVAPAAASATEAPCALVLQAPLTTVMALDDHDAVSSANTSAVAAISATITVPADAPADLGVGAFVTDQHGRWFQRLQPTALMPGTTTVRLMFSDGAADTTAPSVLSEPDRAAWTAVTAATATRAGLFFWSAAGSRARLAVQVTVERVAPVLATVTTGRLLDLHLSSTHVACGDRFRVSVAPSPWPANPYDDRDFALDLRVTAPNGSDLRIPGFYAQPMARLDRGDAEELRRAGAGRMQVRFRPQQPGTYRLRLEARWGAHAALTTRLPDLHVTGPAWDGYARVDAKDPRFLSVDGGWWWPLGPNLRSVADQRSVKYLGTVLTPDRGTFAYDAYCARLGASGATAIEVWLSSWNLALEWRRDWPGFQGRGRYSDGNAWRLDHLLDSAFANGLRVNLVLTNHGQISVRTDAEWDSNPWARDQGGPLANAADWFIDAGALDGQERLRRYLIARYADHPGLLAWKLFSEVNLTAAGEDTARLTAWHRRAATRLHALDVYGHPVTTHWSGDWRSATREIAELPEIDLLCVDAYHRRENEGGGQLLANLLASTALVQPGRPLSAPRFNKPVLVSEYGGDWDGAPEAQLLAEHAAGPWVALVCGHAGAPMLWWFEWLDQGNRWGPYRALSRFVRGEDLRGANACSLPLPATSPDGGLWARCWSRPGLALGYVQDRRWGAVGGAAALHENASLTIGAEVAPGPLRLEWWSADDGRLLQALTLDHPGGPLTVSAPPFQRHLAFKLKRER